jgi:hypothetical protein
VSSFLTKPVIDHTRKPRGLAADGQWLSVVEEDNFNSMPLDMIGSISSCMLDRELVFENLSQEHRDYQFDLGYDPN